jgi:glycosyltransferase involved in cell wall biosynthesis
VPLPGVGGLETHYSEIIEHFSSLGAPIILLCPKLVKDNDSSNSFEIKMKKKNVKILRIPISPPNLYYEKAGSINYIFLIVKMLMFWAISTFYAILAVKKYRPRSCLMRHTLLFYPLPWILKLYKVRIIGDGDVVSSSGVYFFFKARALAKRSPAKNGHFHNTIFIQVIQCIVEKLEQDMFSHYDSFRAISPSLACDPQLKRLISNEKIVMIPPAVDVSRIPCASNCVSDVAYFGVLEEFEGLETLLRSFAKVLKHHPYLKLHIFGDGPLRQKLQEMVKELDIASSVIFYGTLPRNRLFSYFSKFNIAVFPRIGGYGHIPIKIIEALAAGKATIATNVKGIGDVFCSREIMFVKPFDEVELTDAILKLLKDERLRKELSTYGQLKARQFDASKTYKKLFELVTSST